MLTENHLATTHYLFKKHIDEKKLRGILYSLLDYIHVIPVDLAVLHTEIIRFPGETDANHWDWQTRWFRPGYPSGSPLTLRASEYIPAVNVCSAQGLFVVNLETSNVNYERGCNP